MVITLIFFLFNKINSKLQGFKAVCKSSFYLCIKYLTYKHFYYYALQKYESETEEDEIVDVKTETVDKPMLDIKSSPTANNENITTAAVA